MQTIASIGNTVDAWNLGLLILRVMVGVTMIAHGYNHIWGGGKINGTAGWFGSMGLKPGILHAWLASITELVAGVFLVLGFLTPFAAAGVLSVMVVAFMTNHRGNGFFIFRPGEGWEYIMNLGAAALAMGAIGAGEWSVDDAIDLHFLGFDGFLITAILGIGGAFALLAIYWRPEKKPAEDAGETS